MAKLVLATKLQHMAKSAETAGLAASIMWQLVAVRAYVLQLARCTNCIKPVSY